MESDLPSCSNDIAWIRCSRRIAFQELIASLSRTCITYGSIFVTFAAYYRSDVKFHADTTWYTSVDAFDASIPLGDRSFISILSLWIWLTEHAYMLPHHFDYKLLILYVHYDDVIMGAIASLTTILTTVYSSVYSGADRRKHESSASLAYVRGIHRGPVNSPHKWPVTRKMFPFEDVIMYMQNGHVILTPNQLVFLHNNHNASSRQFWLFMPWGIILAISEMVIS